MIDRNKAYLFDLDGVIIDTEPQYDKFWSKTAADYQLGIEQFERVIKGTTLPNILAKYFSHLSPKNVEQLEAQVEAFETQMDMTPVAGALEFLQQLKAANIKTGLVTSSNDAKLQSVFAKLPIQHYFNTIVSANRITHGKPHPMCYLLAAQDLGVAPADCYVFEDSFNGIKSGNAAGMQVVGLSTTNSADSISKDCVKVIPNFLTT
jgi:HAD superfamily hydrolase (TIGR01509 family)